MADIIHFLLVVGRPLGKN